MSNQNLEGSLQAAALMLTLALAPAANAQARETGVGPIVAEQGNQALRIIRAEASTAMLVLKPAMPKPAPARVSAPTGTATSVAATVRCAE